MGTNWVSWSLIAIGGLMLVAEVVLGVATGFDLALVGLSLAVGGGLGLLFGSTLVALFSAGAMAFIYLGLFRTRIRSKLITPGIPSNIDAILGSRAIVTAPITPDSAGQVKVGHEIWRAALASTVTEPREAGASVIVESVDGVTLIVR
jgi:membrane protein implicated in regulation of membrane protease activity